LALGGVIETWLTRRNVWSPATVDAREVLIRRERRPIVPPAEDVMSSVEEDLGY